MSREAWIAVIAVGVVVLVAALVGTIVLAIRLVKVRNLLGDLGFGGKVAFYGALIFTIFPVDLLPDPIYLDDMGVLGLALLYLNSLLKRRQDQASIDRMVSSTLLSSSRRGTRRDRSASSRPKA